VIRHFHRLAFCLLALLAVFSGGTRAADCVDAEGQACGMKEWFAANAQLEQARRPLAEELARLDDKDPRVRELLREVADEDTAWTRRYRDACYAVRLADSVPGIDERQLLCFASAMLERVPDLQRRHEALRPRIERLPAAPPPPPRTCDASPAIVRGRIAPCLAQAMADRCNEHDACLLTCQAQAKEPPYGGGCAHGCAGLIRMRPELGGEPPGAALCAHPVRKPAATPPSR
jgi:hypothetical protein